VSQDDKGCIGILIRTLISYLVLYYFISSLFEGFLYQQQHCSQYYYSTTAVYKLNLFCDYTVAITTEFVITINNALF